MGSIQVDGETIYLFEFTYKVETDWLSPPVSIHRILMWNLDKNKTVIGKNLPPDLVVLGNPSDWGQLAKSGSLQLIDNPESYDYVVSELLDAADLIRMVKNVNFFKIVNSFFPDPSAQTAFGKPEHVTVECKLNAEFNLLQWEKGSKIPVGLTQIVNLMEGMVERVFPSSR